MPFDPPPIRELSAQTETEVASRLGLGALLPRSVLYGLSRAFAGASYHALGRLQWLYRQVFEDTADGPELERRASLRRVYRKPAVPAVGSITFTGTAATVPLGTRARRADGTEYETTSVATFGSGTATAPAQAVVAALAGNAAAATTLSLSSPIVGINSSAVVAAGGMVNGVDRESDDALRSRLLQTLRTPPQGGAPADYVLWALEVPGVTRAWAKRAYPAPGNVGVLFVVDGDPGGIVPNPTKVAEVQAYIDPRAPATAAPIVYAPGTVVVNVSLHLTIDTTAIRTSVTAALVELFNREAEPGATMYVSHVREAISNAGGEVDHTLTTPAADVVPAATAIAVLGTVTFT